MDLPSARGAGLVRRKLKSSEAERFSPSFGVHQGFIPDPHWPPPRPPSDRLPMQRRALRVPATFTVIAGGLPAKVHGDLSSGGAMFVLPRTFEGDEVLVQYGEAAARLKLLATSQREGLPAHHGRFVASDDGAAVWAAFCASERLHLS